MYKRTHGLYTLFAGLVTGGTLVTIFALVSTTLLDDTTLQHLWISLAVSLSSLFMAVIMFRDRLSSFLRIIFSLLLYGAVFFGAKYFQIMVLKRVVTTLPKDLPLAVIALSLFFLNLLLVAIIQSRYQKIVYLLREETRFNERETYLSWVREQISGQGVNIHASRMAGTMSNLAILILILSFITLVLQPGYKMVVSIAFVGFSLAALGLYLLIYQLQSILDWKLLGLSVPEKTTHNWNRMIFLLLSLSLIVSLALPWYFRVFDFSNLNQGLKDRISGVNISINPDPGEVNFTPGTNDNTATVSKPTVYVISRLEARVWKGVNRTKAEVLKQMQTLEVKLTSPSLTRQVFSLDKYGPYTLYSDDLKKENELDVSSTNTLLASIREDGQIYIEFVVEKRNETTVIEAPVDEAEQASVRMGTIRAILWSLLGLIIFYFISAIIGGILSIRYRYTRRTAFVQFFINRYQSLKGLINAIFFFFRLIGRFFMALLGLNKGSKKNKEDLSNPVARQLYQLFKEKGGMSDEKKGEVITIIREFVKLIDVTSRLIVPYRFFYGPKEYLDKVVSFQPDLRKILDKISTLFNESRYSKHILGEAKLKAFSGSVSFALEQINKLDVGLKSQSERETDQKGT